MIGLALVGMAGVVGASLTKTFRDTFDNSVAADYFVQKQPTPGSTRPRASPPRSPTRSTPSTSSTPSSATGSGSASCRSTDETQDLFTSDFEPVVEDHLDGDIIAGGLADADPDTSIAVHEDPADRPRPVGRRHRRHHLPRQRVSKQLTVAAIYTDATIFGNWMVDNAVWEQHMTRQDLGFVSATIAGFSDDLPEAEQEALLAQAGAALEPIEEQFPSIQAENRVEFRQSQEEQLNSFLAVIFVLLGLSLLIALIGITNTLALSVFERTREIGLVAGGRHDPTTAPAGHSLGGGDHRHLRRLVGHRARRDLRCRRRDRHPRQLHQDDHHPVEPARRVSGHRGDRRCVGRHPSPPVGPPG